MQSNAIREHSEFACALSLFRIAMHGISGQICRHLNSRSKKAKRRWQMAFFQASTTKSTNRLLIIVSFPAVRSGRVCTRSLQNSSCRSQIEPLSNDLVLGNPWVFLPWISIMSLEILSQLHDWTETQHVRIYKNRQTWSTHFKTISRFSNTS